MLFDKEINYAFCAQVRNTFKNLAIISYRLYGEKKL